MNDQHSQNGPENEVKSPTDNSQGTPSTNAPSTVSDAALIEIINLDPAGLSEWLDAAIHDKFDVLLECHAVSAAIADSNACGFELDELDIEVWARSVTADTIQVPFSFTLVGEPVDECQPSFPVEGNAVAIILPGGRVQFQDVDVGINDEVRLDPELEDEL